MSVWGYTASAPALCITSGAFTPVAWQCGLVCQRGSSDTVERTFTENLVLKRKESLSVREIVVVPDGAGHGETRFELNGEGAVRGGDPVSGVAQRERGDVVLAEPSAHHTTHFRLCLISSGANRYNLWYPLTLQFQGTPGFAPLDSDHTAFQRALCAVVDDLDPAAFVGTHPETRLLARRLGTLWRNPRNSKMKYLSAALWAAAARAVSPLGRCRSCCFDLAFLCDFVECCGLLCGRAFVNHALPRR